MWLQLAVVAWALRDHSYSLVICSEEFNILAAFGAAAAAALSLLQQCSSPKVFFKKFTLQNEALRETREEMLKWNFDILEFYELLKPNMFNLYVLCYITTYVSDKGNP
jgi:hypothetical protein